MHTHGTHGKQTRKRSYTPRLPHSAAAYGLISSSSRIFALGQRNAVLGFLLDGAPAVREQRVDGKKVCARARFPIWLPSRACAIVSLLRVYLAELLLIRSHCMCRGRWVPCLRAL